MFKKSNVAAIAVLVISLATIACKDEQLKILAKTTRSIAVACNDLTDYVIKANQDKLLTDAQAVPIVQTIRRIVVANDKANAAIEPLSQLDPNSKNAVLQILQPLLKELDAAIKEGAFPISDAGIKTKIQLALVGVKGFIDTAILVLQ